MSYEFKKLSAVDTVETVGDAAKVLIEEDGVIKKIAKDEVSGINPNKLSAVEILSDNANVLIEENGIVKKVSKTAVGSANSGNNSIVITIDTGDYSNVWAPDNLYEMLDAMITDPSAVRDICVYTHDSDRSRFWKARQPALFKYDDFLGISADNFSFEVYPDGRIIGYYED